MARRSRDAKPAPHGGVRRDGTVLIDRACAGTHLAPLVGDLLTRVGEVRGDAPTRPATAREGRGRQ